MAENSQRNTVIVAIISVVGSIAVAAIGNWDKIFSTPSGMHSGAPPAGPDAVTTEDDNQRARRDPTPGEPGSPSIVPIAGEWRDPVNPVNRSRITQNGTSYHYVGSGALPTGVAFRTDGEGTVTGFALQTTYHTEYENGWQAQGVCTGTVTADGGRMTMNCTDNLLGGFTMTAVRH